MHNARVYISQYFISSNNCTAMSVKMDIFYYELEVVFFIDVSTVVDIMPWLYQVYIDS